jgi:hypothetical protein
MKSLFVIVMIAGCVLSDAVAVELRTVAGETPFQQGRREALLQKVPREDLTKQPDFKNPLYITLELGSGRGADVTAVIDESAGKGKGYDAIYIDANNNRDLTDDVVIRPEVVKAGKAVSINTEPVAVVVKYADGSMRTIRIVLALHGGQHGRSAEMSWSAAYGLVEHLEGTLDIGERKGVAVAVYDSTAGEVLSNGCFDDFCVDRWRIDLNGDGVLDEETEDFPLSRAISLDGGLWALRIDAAGKNVEVVSSELPAGRIGFNFVLVGGVGISEGLVQIVSDDGYAFGCAVSGDSLFSVPAAEYRIVRAKVLATDGKGAKWVAVFLLSEPSAVKPGEHTVISLGAPVGMRTVTVGDVELGGHICVSPVLTGVAGEVYENISLEGTRMAPAVRIVDTEDIVLSEGNMDYG